MIGNMIAKIRKEKGMTKTELARITNINIGHLTHIEKGERNPSHKALKNICKALEVPYQQLMYTYDKTLTEDQSAYGFVDHIGYDKVLAVDSVNSFIDCPASLPNASIAVKMNDISMEPKFKKDEYLFIEFNSPLSNNEIGLFSFNNEILIRKYSLKNGNIILTPLNTSFDKLSVSGTDDFYIIGKVLENI